MIDQNGERLHAARATTVKNAHIPNAGCVFRLFRLYCSIRRGNGIQHANRFGRALSLGASAVCPGVAGTATIGGGKAGCRTSPCPCTRLRRAESIDRSIARRIGRIRSAAV
jgi:hypothetical protein